MFGLKLLTNSEFTELKETITTYQRTLDDIGWINLSMDSEMGIEQITSLEGFVQMIKRCKFYFYTNPLAGQWINLTTNFVFGEGLPKPRSIEPKIQEIIDSFWENVDNKISVTSFQAQHLLCNKLQYEGNLFFLLFDDDKGDVRVRILNTEDVSDIIRSSSDKNRNNFYKVSEKTKRYNFESNSYEYQQSEYVYYPDCNIFDESEHNVPVNKLKTGVKILHIKINSDINDKFGFPDLYRGIDWQKAHTSMLSDVSTLVKALSKFAWKKKVKGSPAKINSLKTNLATKTNLSNISNSSGQTQLENEGIDLTSIKIETGGVKIGVDGGRQMLLQNCAASGIPEHYYGNPETGNLATSKSMELPVLKKFTTYQSLWACIYQSLLQYQIDRKIEVGLLPGNTIIDKKNQRKIYESPLNRIIDIDFPPILEEDLKTMAEALGIAKTNNLVCDETAAQIFLNAANMNNIEEEINKIDFSKPTPTPIIPVKESIETPGRDSAVKMTKKTNYLLQRMNGYRKSLTGNFRQLQNDIKKSIITAGEKGYVVGNIKNLDSILDSFAKSMKDSAYEYFPIAVDIGKSYLQSHLNKQIIKETLFEAQGRTHGLLQEKLTWNDNYVTTSLVPDIRSKIENNMKDYYDSPQKFNYAITEAVLTFESRIEQYVGAFWRVEEAAVKDAGKGTGLMVNFIGADDSGTCDGCNSAMEGNPYSIDSAPEPGSHE
ncbi:MAG: hypothetical protein ABIH71_07300, partial [Candidatus Omnitrophota bacterium]